MQRSLPWLPQRERTTAARHLLADYRGNGSAQNA
jgi:hypothetical protein